MATDNCLTILNDSLSRANAKLNKSFISNTELQKAIAYVNLCPNNRSGARFLLATTLAKLDTPKIDIRKPFIQAYPETGRNEAYSGRHYDEQYIFEFITRHNLPCSPTTAFLTPGFRTKNIVLTLDTDSGVNPALKEAFLSLRKAAETLE